MSDRRHRSTPPALPEGYQYGDARVFEVGDVRRCADGVWECFDGVEWFRTLRPEFWLIGGILMSRPAMGCRIADEPWRAPHENAAAQLMRRVKLTGDDQPGPAIPNIDAQRTGEETI